MHPQRVSPYIPCRSSQRLSSARFLSASPLGVLSSSLGALNRWSIKLDRRPPKKSRGEDPLISAESTKTLRSIHLGLGSNCIGKKRLASPHPFSIDGPIAVGIRNVDYNKLHDEEHAFSRSLLLSRILPNNTIHLKGR